MAIKSTPGGNRYDDTTGVPTDQATALNRDSRDLEVLSKAQTITDQVSDEAAQAVSTANEAKTLATTATNTATSAATDAATAKTAAQSAEATVDALTGPWETRLGDLEVLGGLAPGDVSDATVESLITNTGTGTNAALIAAVEEPWRPKIPVTGVPVAINDAGNRKPYWLGRDRKTIYSGGSSILYVSTDDGASWQPADSFQFTPWIRGIRELSNGELMVSTAAYQGVPGGLYVSTGWGTGTTTWTKKLDAGAGGAGPSSAFSNNWGMDVHKNIVVVAEYGLQQPGDASRFVYLSTDHGDTWALIYDIGTAVDAHVHAAFYDPWWKAIWVTQGDQANRAVKVSFDMGATFTTVDNPHNVQVVGGIALPGCLLFGTDYQPDGIFRVERTQDRAGLVLEPAYAMVEGAPVDRRRFIAGMPYWSGRKGDPVLFPFVSDESWTDSARLIATEDGYTFREVWRDTQEYQFKGLSTTLGPTESGTYHGALTDNRTPEGASLVKWSYMAPVVSATAGDPSYVEGNPGSGSYTDGDVIRVGTHAYTPTGVGTVQVAGGATNYENVVGGNLANVNTSNSNLAGAVTMTGQDGNWVTVTGGYDNVVRGWAIVLGGFHNKVADGANHCTIGGGSLHTVNTGVAYSTIGGGTGHTLTGNIATIGGGQDNEAGLNATVAGGLANKATSNGGTIGGGGSNLASGPSSTVAGGAGNTASGVYSTVVGGNQATASGDGSVAAGRESTASGVNSVALGRGAHASREGEVAHAGGKFTTAGDAQAGMIVLKRETTSATPGDLAAWSGGVPAIRENETMAFEAIIVARRADVDGDNAAWKVAGLVKRDAGATTALVGTPTVTSISASAGATSWAVTVGTYSVGQLRFSVTGEAGKTIRWVGRIVSAQVIG